MPPKQDRKQTIDRKKKVLSVAIHPTLATTRELLVQTLGCEVTSVFNLLQLKEACEKDAYDLLMISQGISLAENAASSHSFAAPLPTLRFSSSTISVQSYPRPPFSSTPAKDLTPSL